MCKQYFASFLLILFLIPILMQAQYLSNLSTKKSQPIYTTYAAPIDRSDYKLDQAYTLMWFNENQNIEFTSKDGGSFGMAFIMNGKLINKTGRFFKEAIITKSYPDLVEFYFYPFHDIRVDVMFDVYSSTMAIAKYTIANEGRYEVSLSTLPYFNIENSIGNLRLKDSAFLFDFEKERDNWMKNHDIPYVEELQSAFLTDIHWNSYGSYRNFPSQEILKASGLSDNLSANHHSLIFLQEHNIPAGGSVDVSIVRGIGERNPDPNRLIKNSKKGFKVDFNKLILQNEDLFSKVPKIQFLNKDHEAIYWNSFNLMNQCMMPPEGECSYNYYVFSREPKWGWGYGGQVFHESLVMLAYAFLDAENAMNSQRVFMERQWPSGYINYRTGPYLNEQIAYNDQFTSSAPWYNWQNWEIYKITGDKVFLREAYESGKKFYDYYVSHRDADNDGLCEWGAHALLESVRDARVAVWDKVGWPSNFEGPDINSMLVMEAKSLAGMASELGEDNEANAWLIDAAERSDLINRYLWDEEDGFYYNVNKTNQAFTYEEIDDLKIKEIIGFLPLWAGIADSVQAARLVSTMTNPNEFWRNYGVPTLSADDDYYNPIGYWNGPIWVQ